MQGWIYLFSFFSRAHGGDMNGSLYLQAFAALLLEHYLKTPLYQIHLMVKRTMSETPQVEYYLNLLQYFSKINCRVVHIAKHFTLKTISRNLKKEALCL